MALTRDRVDALRATAREVREDIVRMVHAAACGHPGGPLGMADFMTTLFLEHLDLTPENRHAEDRDRFVLGNGHTCAGYYALLAQKGLLDREQLLTFRKMGSPLQGHPHRNLELGIDFSTGSLGNGLSVAATAIVSGNRAGACTSSDGESQEGQIWEAATSAAHWGLSNLTVIVDFNDIQIDGRMRDVMDVRDLRAKYAAFGWHAVEIDGHDVVAIDHALCEAKAETERPSAIIARTTIGKGVSFMEDQSSWHGVAPNDEQLAQALEDLAAAAS